MSQNTLWSTLAVIVVLGVASYFLFFSDEPLVGEVQNDRITTFTNMEDQNSVGVADQKPGSSVIIAEVNLSEGGFVNIHEDVKGNAGASIGTSGYLSAGTHHNVVIELKRQTREGEKLHAMLHKDNGDKIFREAVDLPVMDEDGDAADTRFEINADASLKSNLDIY